LAALYGLEDLSLTTSLFSSRTLFLWHIACLSLFTNESIVKVASRLITLFPHALQDESQCQQYHFKVYSIFTANMHSNMILSGLSVLFALGNAVPLNNGKRDVVWVTEVETAVETVPITTTVWVDPTSVPFAHAHRHKHSKSSSKSAVEVKPTPSSVSSSSSEAYVAPSSYETSSTYVEPTTTSSPEPVTTAQAEQTTSSTPEPETTQAAVTPESSYVAPVSSYEAPSSTYVAPVSSYEAPSSTSVYVAPSSTSVYEAPSSTSTYEAPSASSSAPASYSSGSSDGNPASGKSYTGEMTYFTPGMGACGHDSSESEHMVAVSMALFDQYTPNGNPNNNPLCGKTVSITSPDGSSHEATIWDRCVGCAEADLDMPQSFFNVVTAKDGKPADGRAYGMSWSMN
jgi:hypothetical protein